MTKSSMSLIRLAIRSVRSLLLGKLLRLCYSGGVQQYLLNPGNYVAVRLQYWQIPGNVRRLMGYKQAYTDKLVSLSEQTPASYYFDVPVAWESVCVQD